MQDQEGPGQARKGNKCTRTPTAYGRSRQPQVQDAAERSLQREMRLRAAHLSANQQWEIMITMSRSHLVA